MLWGSEGCRFAGLRLKASKIGQSKKSLILGGL